MYRYVSGISKVKPYRKECVALLTQIQKQLKEKLNIHAMIVLIGSGSRKLVTQNGNGSYDLDYNLTIEKLPKELERNPKKLKDFVRSHLDLLIKEKALKYSSGKDSTSVITYVKHDEEGKEIFSFDLGIVAKVSSNENWNRLLYNKKQNSYEWAEQRHTSKLASRAKKIHKQGEYRIVRDLYLQKKNQALSEAKDVSSFELYASTINEVEQKINGKK